MFEFEHYERTNTIRVSRVRDGQPAIATYCLWFAWYAIEKS